MMRWFFAIAPSLLSFVYASPYIDRASSTQTLSTRAEEPCAQVSSLLAGASDQLKIKLSPDLALQCLRSVPLDANGAALQMTGLDTMTDFQSTLAYLKNPPPGYLYPAVDIKGGLQKISDRVQNGDYTNEYDFQNDIYLLVSSTHDFHFNYYPDISQVFYFIRSNGLFSVSRDGQSLPDVYVDTDMYGGTAGRNYSNYTASPVTQINSQPVETFLRDLADAEGTYQDPDANYNSLFPNIPNQSNDQGAPTIFEQSNQYQGNQTVVTFKNGTTFSIDTYAVSLADFKGVTDGRSFFDKLLNGKLPTVTATASAVLSSAVPSSAASSSVAPSSLPSSSLVARDVGSSSIVIPSRSAVPSSAVVSGSAVVSSQVPYSPVPSQTVKPAPPFFPNPWVVAHDNSVACYFPAKNPDLAVIEAPTFAPSNHIEFQDIVRECLATSSKLGKKKLIIDLRSNTGGKVMLGFDMFKQLFPSILPWGAVNFRAFELFNDIGKVVTDYYEDTTYYNAGNGAINTNFASIFNEQEELDGMYENFGSWKDLYGPIHVHGDTFTNLVRYNFSDLYQTNGIQVSDFGQIEDIVPKQTFASENIIMLQDGACGSTCAVFAELMKTQGKVRSVAMGGRRQYGAMQGVGGSKGANVYSSDYLLDVMKEAFNKDASASEQKMLEKKYGDAYAGLVQANKRAAKNDEGSMARINIRNNIRKGDETLTPLQFVYEAADCRLFYTAAMILDQTLVWQAASAAHWDSGKCLLGSHGEESSNPGTDYLLTSPDGGTTATLSRSPWGPTPTGASITSTTSGMATGKHDIGVEGLLAGLVAFAFSLLIF